MTVVGKTFAKRNGHQAFSYRGSLWVVGGNNNAGFDFNDVWRSADGEDWELVTTAVRRFGGRQQHQVAVHTIPFVYQGTAVVVRGPEELLWVFPEDELPATLATLTASGGIGRLRFDVMADAQGVATVGADDGVLAATAFVEGVSTVTVRVRDETPGNSGMMAVTITFVSPFSLAADSAEYVMSPGFVGSVHVLAVRGGVRSYSYARVAGTTALAVDAAGVVSMVTPLASGERATAVFAIMDKVGKSLRFTMSVRALEAGAYGGGELLYLIGGSSGGEEVWRTADGRNWTQLPVYPPSFSKRSEHQALSYRGSLWVVGGDAGGGEVWRSRAGMHWDRVAVGSPSFEPRFGHQVVEYDGNLWLIGGVRH